MRIMVVGTSGSGKTTLGRKLAGALTLPFVELDAINWQPGWRSLTAEDPTEFQERVAEATAGERWVVDGNYGKVREALWERATHLVWLDYPRYVVMSRVIRRSVMRAVDRRELWAGNREDWRNWLDANHPIRWAWDTLERRRRETEARIREPRFAHLRVVHLRHPREAGTVLQQLT